MQKRDPFRLAAGALAVALALGCGGSSAESDGLDSPGTGDTTPAQGETTEAADSRAASNGVDSRGDSSSTKPSGSSDATDSSADAQRDGPVAAGPDASGSQTDASESKPDTSAGKPDDPDAGGTSVPPPPPAKPFGTWTHSCSATPYPRQVSNAYPIDFQQAVADDWVYVAWVWRLSPDAATNHSVSAMKSKDMKVWYNLCGERITLPVTPASRTVIDPVPIKNGLLNGRMRLSFDRKRRAVITYAKNIAKRFRDGSSGKTTQVFNARVEGKAIKVYQLTNWSGLDAFGGGGSLPLRKTAVSFSGVRLAASGDVMAITLNRSSAEDEACEAAEEAGERCEAFPPDGTWQLDDSSHGLALRSPLKAVSSAAFRTSDPYENPSTRRLDVGPVENAPLSNASRAAQWLRRVMYSRSETRWITLRGDFDRDGQNNPGLFDRYNSRFRLEADGKTRVFQFGSRAALLWPLVGDWNQDGMATIGVHQATKAMTYLKNSLAGGKADVTQRGPLAQVPYVGDSPLRWHDANPAARYAIKWEALPPNRDYAYDCNGIPLDHRQGCQDADRMSSNLYLYEYDPSAKVWRRSRIDRAWGGIRVGFDFVTFKNVQFVLYYGSSRRAKVAQRVRRAGTWSSWKIVKLDTTFGGWDSHNYLTMTIDMNHHVHISGNMHVDPLVYFRGTGFLGKDEPLTYRKMSMTGLNERRVTYPKFFRSPDGKLLFMYRSGSSGSGDTYLNVYDELSSRWAPLNSASSAPVSLFKGS
jgi:hypothetical protein